MNDKPEIEVGKLPVITKFIYTLGVLPTSYLMSMTYQEQVTWLYNYLQTQVIPAINTDVEAVQELQNLYELLRTYVNDYFENLDVQEEINNKLDEMAESGQLTDIIAQYLGLAGMITFNNVAEMKQAKNLVNGSKCCTLGFYNVNDGGEATYKIRTVTNDDIVDNMFIIELNDDTLIAELVFDNEINIKQLGARSQTKENEKYDIKNYIDSYLNKQNELKKQLKLYIPFGIWYTSGNLFYGKYGFYIYGDEKFPGFSNYANGTIITSYNNNQDYIFRIGNSNNPCHNWVLKNIVFSSSDFIYNENQNFEYSTEKEILKTLELHYAEYGITDNLFFQHIKGKALTINSSWENYFKLLNFRNIENINGCIMNMETKDTTLSQNANITANTFEKIMFEKVQGNLINFEDDCRCYNNHFGVINVEPNKIENGVVYTTINSETINNLNDNNDIHYAIFNLEDDSKFSENIIDNIELNNYGLYYFTKNNTNYLYDTIIKMGNNNNHANIYNSIASNGGYKKIKVIYLPSTVTVVSQTTNYSTFGKFVCDTQEGFMFDVNGLAGIYANNSVLTGINPDTYQIPSQELFMNGNWIPCYKTKPKRSYASNGLGALYYDVDSSNNLKIIVKPRTANNDLDRGIASSVVGLTKKFGIRAKVPSGETCRLIINDLDDSTKNVSLNCEGDGTYKVYTADLTNMNIGDKLLITVSSNTSYQRNISCDVFISN